MFDPSFSHESRYNVTVSHAAVLTAASTAVLDRLDRASDLIRQFPQIEVATEHLLHGGMYARTIRRGPGVVAVGSIILRATVLIVCGDCSLVDGDGRVHRFTGYSVLPGMAGRKSLSLTHSEVQMTMIFPTSAKTVEEAENEIFGEAEDLMSRKDGSKDTFVVTGE